MKNNAVLKNQKGFTVVELIVTFAVIVLGGLIILGVSAAFLLKDDTEVQSLERHCIDGYSFTVSSDGKPVQILNDKGGGVSCSN